MLKSKRLSLNEIRDAFRLVGEVCELGHQPLIWRRHLVDQLVIHVDATDGFCQEEYVGSQSSPERIIPCSIHSRQAIPKPGWVNLCAIYRSPDAAPFALRDRSFVELVHEELARLWNAPPDPDPIENLPPRAQSMMRLFRQGMSEKQVAIELGLSPQTIHTYVRNLHRQFGVNTRYELLERFRFKARVRPRLNFESGPCIGKVDAHKVELLRAT